MVLGPRSAASADTRAENPSAVPAETPPHPAGDPSRRLSQADVVGLGINCVVGSGIFFLPGPAARELGPASLMAVLAAGGLALLVALCFAEAGSRFAGSGGAYLYSRAAFGPLPGFLVGWVATLGGTVAWGAIVKAWTLALARFVPEAGRWPGQAVAVLALLAVLGAVNLAGAKPAAWLSNAFTAAKLACLATFVAAGATAVDPALFSPFRPHGLGALPRAVLLLLYAYVGFENLVVPAGEMRDPRRSLPRAVGWVLLGVTALYASVQAVAIGLLPEIAGAENAVGQAAERAFGTLGGGFIAAGILVSVVGINTASALILPRRLSALAEQGDLPRGLARPHPRWGTPWLAILIVYAATGLAALSGTFEELVLLSVVARLLQYVPTCLAVLAFRRGVRPGVGEPAFRLPCGPLVPLAALGLCAWLLSTLGWTHLLAAGAAALTGLPFYLATRRAARGRPASRTPSGGAATA